jgi:hypothetical protein
VRKKEEHQNERKKEKKKRTNDVQFDGTHHAVRYLLPLLQFKKNLASHDLYGYILLSRASIPPFENRKKKKTLRAVAARHEYDWRMAITPQKPGSIDLTSP